MYIGLEPGEISEMMKKAREEAAENDKKIKAELARKAETAGKADKPGKHRKKDG